MSEKKPTRLEMIDEAVRRVRPWLTLKVSEIHGQFGALGPHWNSPLRGGYSYTIERPAFRMPVDVTPAIANRIRSEFNRIAAESGSALP